MVRIYKNWYLDADSESYFVGKKNQQGELENPARYKFSADAVNHIIEAEMREKVSKPELLECCEFTAMYSAVADEVIEAVLRADTYLPGMKHAACKPMKHYKPQGIETRGKA